MRNQFAKVRLNRLGGVFDAHPTRLRQQPYCGRHIFGAYGSASHLNEGTIRLRQKTVEGNRCNQSATPLGFEHSGIDRKKAAQFDGSTGIAKASSEPVQDHAPAVWGKMSFDQIQNSFAGADGVHREDLGSGACARLQDLFEDPLLKIERTVIAWPGVEADFADIACLRQVFLPESYLGRMVGYQLRVQTQGCTDMARFRSEITISRPCPWCRRNCESVYVVTVASRDCRCMVWVEIKVAMEVYEERCGHAIYRGRAQMPATKAATSSMPRWYTSAKAAIRDGDSSESGPGL